MRHIPFYDSSKFLSMKFYHERSPYKIEEKQAKCLPRKLVTKFYGKYAMIY